MDLSQDVMENLTVDGLRHLYEVNSIGPAMVIKVPMDYIFLFYSKYPVPQKNEQKRKRKESGLTTQ